MQSISICRITIGIILCINLFPVQPELIGRCTSDMALNGFLPFRRNSFVIYSRAWRSDFPEVYYLCKMVSKRKSDE